MKYQSENVNQCLKGNYENERNNKLLKYYKYYGCVGNNNKFRSNKYNELYIK